MKRIEKKKKDYAFLPLLRYFLLIGTTQSGLPLPPAHVLKLKLSLNFQSRNPAPPKLGGKLFISLLGN